MARNIDDHVKQVCKVCNGFIGYGITGNVLCDDCRERQAAERWRKRQHFYDRYKREWVLVEDPSEYPLESGMRLGKLEVEYMLKLGTFAPGTRLKHIDGKRYRVIEQDGKQVLARKGEYANER